MKKYKLTSYTYDKTDPWDDEDALEESLVGIIKAEDILSAVEQVKQLFKPESDCDAVIGKHFDEYDDMPLWAEVECCLFLDKDFNLLGYVDEYYAHNVALVLVTGYQIEELPDAI